MIFDQSLKNDIVKETIQLMKDVMSRLWFDFGFQPVALFLELLWTKGLGYKIISVEEFKESKLFHTKRLNENLDLEVEITQDWSHNSENPCITLSTICFINILSNSEVTQLV